ncbi:putative leucine-rich repeat 2 [Arabidopsis thaliana]
MPLSLYICETIINLRLHRIYLDSLESISLPRLKTVHLQLNVYANDAGLESFISSYPAHEDFSIVRSVDIDDNVNVLRVHSQTLKSLSVEFDLGEWGLGLLCFGQRYLGLWIDDPRSICCFKVNFVGFYMSHGVGLSKQQMARNFFTGISRVRDLIISADIFIDCYLKEESLSQFCKLSCLKAEVCSSNVKIRETLQKPFESCPNLKSIFLVMTCTNPRALT